MINTAASSNIIQHLYGNNVLVAREKPAHEMTAGEEEVIERLKARDEEVRIHEAAHASSPGVIPVGGIRYNYEIGPDGKAYAIGGNVTLSSQPAQTPEQAIAAAQALKRAAMAPGEPSPQDMQAANAGAEMEAEAVNKLYEKNARISAENFEKKGSIINTFA